MVCRYYNRCIIKFVFTHFKKCIITDGKEYFEQISKYLCVSYKSQIKTTLELYNLLELEQINTDKIINEIGTVKELVIKNFYEQRNKEYEKEKAGPSHCKLSLGH
jgi:hypothetical protein